MAVKKNTRVDTRDVKLSDTPGVPDLALQPADLGTDRTMESLASGALIEDGVKDTVDLEHPAVDDRPREGTSVASNLIDFNDPNPDNGQAQVKANLERAGYTGQAPEAEAAEVSVSSSSKATDDSEGGNA